MNGTSVKHSAGWTNFTIMSFVIAASMMAGGIFFMDAGFAAKGFYSMSAIMLVQSSITITKTLRDNEEAEKYVNKVEDARNERLIMNISGNKGD